MAGTGPANAGLSNKNSSDFDAAVSTSSPAAGAPGGEPSGNGNGRQLVRSLAIKAACLVGGAYLLKRLTKTTTRWDHSRIVAQSLSAEKVYYGEDGTGWLLDGHQCLIVLAGGMAMDCFYFQFSTEQANRDPMTYFNLRMLTCPATILADGARVLYFEQAFWRTPERPYRQRFYMVKPCPKEMKCDVEVASYAVNDIEEYRNFCDRPKNQRPQPVEIVGDMGEHLTTVYLSKCERGRRCLYEGSTPAGGFPNSWNGATRSTSELTIFKAGELHCWDRAYDDEGNQVWGVRQGPYEFKPGNSSTSGLVSELDFINTLQKEDKTLSTFSS